MDGWGDRGHKSARKRQCAVALHDENGSDVNPCGEREGERGEGRVVMSDQNAHMHGQRCAFQREVYVEKVSNPLPPKRSEVPKRDDGLAAPPRPILIFLKTGGADGASP